MVHFFLDSEFRHGSHFMALRGNSIGRFVFHREFFLVMDPLGTRYFLDVQTRVIVAGNVKSSNIAIIWRKVKKSFVQNLPLAQFLANYFFGYQKIRVITTLLLLLHRYITGLKCTNLLHQDFI